MLPDGGQRLLDGDGGEPEGGGHAGSAHSHVVTPCDMIYL